MGSHGHEAYQQWKDSCEKAEEGYNFRVWTQYTRQPPIAVDMSACRKMLSLWKHGDSINLFLYFDKSTYQWRCDGNETETVPHDEKYDGPKRHLFE